MVIKLRNELLNRMPEIFATENPQKHTEKDRRKDDLERKVGQLTMGLIFFEKKGSSGK